MSERIRPRERTSAPFVARKPDTSSAQQSRQAETGPLSSRTPAPQIAGPAPSAEQDLGAPAAEQAAPGLNYRIDQIPLFYEAAGAAPATVQRKAADAHADSFKVDQGQLTFDAEGTEGGRYHTRTIHWPGGVSGVTIGRGYDLGQHTREQIVRDMVAAGISKADAQKFAEAAGLKGAAAQKFVNDNKAGMPEISPEQQEKLFEITYNSYAANAERISNKKDVKEKYGETDWDGLHPAIRDIVVDLLYRGDYTSRSRQLIQSLIADNDLKGLYAVMADRSNWKSVPKDRFDRRVRYLEQALKGGTPEPLDRDQGEQQSGAKPGESEHQTGGAEAPAEEQGAAQATATVTSDALNVRSGPSTQSGKIGKLLKGQQIEVLGEHDGWLKIAYQGKTAYVSAAYTTYAHAEEAHQQTPAGEQQGGAAAGGSGEFKPIGPVLSADDWLSQYSGAGKGHELTTTERAGVSEDASCYRASLAMLNRAGFQVLDRTKAIQLLQEQHGKNEVTAQAGVGLAYIDQQLEEGRPVIVGVDHKVGTTYNADHTTDHFVVVVEKNIDSAGKIYYRFFDPYTRHMERGISPNNKLYLNGNTATGMRSDNKREYHLAQVRKNQETE